MPNLPEIPANAFSLAGYADPQRAVIGSGPAAIGSHRRLFETLRWGAQNIGSIGSFIGRYLPPVARVSPLLMLSGLGPQPQPGRYDIPSGGTPQWRAKYPDMARAYDTQRRQDASVRKLRGLANFYATRSARR